MKDTERLPGRELTGASVQNQSISHRRILVVDHDQDVRQLSLDVLAAGSYHVEAAPDGAAAWESLQASRFDLIITDNKMPRLTGIEMIERLRSAHMAIPVIIATRYLPSREIARKPWLNPVILLQRPFTNEDLLEAVKTILDRDNGQQLPAMSFTGLGPAAFEITAKLNPPRL